MFQGPDLRQRAALQGERQRHRIRQQEVWERNKGKHDHDFQGVCVKALPRTGGFSHRNISLECAGSGQADSAVSLLPLGRTSPDQGSIFPYFGFRRNDGFLPNYHTKKLNSD
jgi:hypothetical protein